MGGYWSGKSALVTGASAGLGRSIAAALAAAGCRVALNGRREESLREAARAIADARPDACEAWPGDVTHQQDVDRLAELVRQRFDRLDLLANCVGASMRAPVLETTPEEFQAAWEANFLSAVRMTRALAPLLIESRGHLVNVGSLASKVAPRFLGAYPATKFAVAAYSQQLRLEQGPAGLHVLLVCPGPIARHDAGVRYAANHERGIPDEALQPGGGANVAAIEPDRLARQILEACERRRPELIVPSRARWLFALSQLLPTWGDRLLLRSMKS